MHECAHQFSLSSDWKEGRKAGRKGGRKEGREIHKCNYLLYTTVLRQVLSLSIQLDFCVRNLVSLYTQKEMGEPFLPRWEEPRFGSQGWGS